MQFLGECAKDILSVRGLCTLGLTGAVIAAALTGRDVPEVLSTAAMMALGFFFARNGQKALSQTK